MSEAAATATGLGLDGRSRRPSGITGSIAAYKAVELLRLLQAEGADVQVLLTAVGGTVRRAADPRGAQPPAGRERRAGAPGATAGSATSSTADSADAIVVAPATAHWLGAMANGLAGDVVTAACLAT